MMLIISRFASYFVVLYTFLQFPIHKPIFYSFCDQYSHFLVQAVNDAPYGMIDEVLTDCEYEGLNIGSELADSFNSMDEATEFDVRVHSDYFVELTGFAGSVNSNLYSLIIDKFANNNN